ncbi:acyl-CoA thioesterase [Halomarina halobia]|uniref:Acyl-CoA thioesterase n=1 Tax=Halomarina halobia TaxID=3033386 RepID=A0ABD6AEB4_9EURY|nr:thioesterase family protein [Halomarina sp. PSR21]
MPHRTDVPITWGDTDAGGLIYYPRLFHFFVVALNDYFTPVADHLMEQLRADGYVLPVVETSASFTTPLRAGDTARIETAIEVGERSLTATFTVTREADGRRAAEGRAVFILVDADFEPTPLPASVRRCVEDRESSATS